MYLAAVLSKRYTNPSSDIITVLTGLNEIDSIFTDFANAIEGIIRSGRSQAVRKKAIDVALSITSGAYQTSLVSYFAHRDLFPALMRYMQDCTVSEDVFDPCLLLGLLANYNKFEYRNPYRLRMEDFVNEEVTQAIAKGLGKVFANTRAKYIEIVDDQPDTSWTLSNTLSSIGLGVLAPIRAINPIAQNEDETKEQFAILPDASAAVLLGVYDFSSVNHMFAFNLVSNATDQTKHGESLASLLSLASYINHHAYRSARASTYGLICMIILRNMIEDAALCKRLCDPNIKVKVRFCRQRAPTLPPTPSSRSGAAQIFDLCIDTINHNLRKRLDLDLYIGSVNLIHRIMVCLAQNRIHLPYHWPHLWASLIALARFLQNYSDALLAYTSLADMQSLLAPLTKVLAVGIAMGAQFLPDSGSHDDLFYKLVECKTALEKLRGAYKLTEANSAINVILTTSTHFHGQLEAKGVVTRALSTKEVTKVIRTGYENLELPDMARLGIESFERWREGDEKVTVKKMARVAVEDVKKLLRER